MDSYEYILKEAKYLPLKGIHFNLPSEVLGRSDIYLSCQVLSSESDPAQLFVYASFEDDTTEYLVSSEQFYGDANSDGDFLANAIVNQIKDNEELIDEIKKLIDYLKK